MHGWDDIQPGCLFLLTNLTFSFRWLFVSAMSLKEAGKLLESKVYDTLQLQVNNYTRTIRLFFWQNQSVSTDQTYNIIDWQTLFTSVTMRMTSSQVVETLVTMNSSFLPSPKRSHDTNCWYSSWVQTIYYAVNWVNSCFCSFQSI